MPGRGARKLAKARKAAPRTRSSSPSAYSPPKSEGYASPGYYGPPSWGGDDDEPTHDDVDDDDQTLTHQRMVDEFPGLLAAFKRVCKEKDNFGQLFAKFHDKCEELEAEIQALRAGSGANVAATTADATTNTDDAPVTHTNAASPRGLCVLRPTWPWRAAAPAAAHTCTMSTGIESHTIATTCTATTPTTTADAGTNTCDATYVDAGTATEHATCTKHAATDADTNTERVDATTDAATNTDTTTTHDVATYADVVRRRPRRDVPPHARRTVAPVSPAAAAVTHTAAAATSCAVPPPPRAVPEFVRVLRKHKLLCRDHALHGNCRGGAACPRDHGGVSEDVKDELRRALRERAAAPPRPTRGTRERVHRPTGRTFPAGATPPAQKGRAAKPCLKPISRVDPAAQRYLWPYIVPPASAAVGLPFRHGSV